MAQMRKQLAQSLLAISCYTVVAFAQCGKDYRSENKEALSHRFYYCWYDHTKLIRTIALCRRLRWFLL